MDETNKKAGERQRLGIKRYFEREPQPDPEPYQFAPRPRCPNPTCQSTWVMWLERMKMFRCRSCGQEFVRVIVVEDDKKEDDSK